MSNPLITFIGWSIVPSVHAASSSCTTTDEQQLATRIVQTVYYGITIRAGDPKPAPGSPRFVKHYRRIQVSLIIAYLFYTFYEASHVVRHGGDFYQTLGIAHDVDEKAIKTRFRRLAALHHPDKAGTTAHAEASDAYFVKLKLAQDTLLKPAQRYAYDRFGPDMLAWEHCSSVRDYLSAGLTAHSPKYIGSAIMLVVLGAVGYLPWARFWRYMLLVCLVILEVYTVTRAYHPPFLVNVVNPILTRVSSYPPLLPFQFLILARNMTFTFFIALSQLGPHLRDGGSTAPTHEIDPMRLNRLEHIARANGIESSRLLDLDLAPYVGDQIVLGSLKDRIREWLVQNTIRADPQVREAVGEALKKRQSAQPADAMIPERTN